MGGRELVLIGVLLALLVCVQYVSEHKLSKQLQILQTDDVSRVGADILLERCPVVVVGGRDFSWAMRFMFPWIAAPQDSEETSYLRGVDRAGLVKVENLSDSPVLVHVANNRSPSQFVAILLKDRSTSVFIPRFHSYFIGPATDQAGTPRVRTHSMYSTLGALGAFLHPRS